MFGGLGSGLCRLHRKTPANERPRQVGARDRLVTFGGRGQDIGVWKTGEGETRGARLRPRRVTGVGRSPGQVQALGFPSIFSMIFLGKADLIGS